MTATCQGCGERIRRTTTATDPVRRRWLHEDWQSAYDHLPTPTPTTRVAPVRAQLAARRDEEQP